MSDDGPGGGETGGGRVAGRVAIVTGAGSTPGPGMATGRACAMVLAREGARVLVADIRADRGGQTRDLIRDEGGTAEVFTGDLRRDADCAAMAAAAVDAFGSVDILVNNIGVAVPGDVTGMPEADWDRCLDLSLRTAFLSSKHVLPVMIARGRGSVVNIGSIVAVRGAGRIGYAAAKGALHAMTVEMAYAHGRQGIRVNTVAPGHITTPLLFSELGVTPETEFRQRMAAATTLLGTEGDGWDVARAAAFLASDDARWITGVTLPVDGGAMAVTPLVMADHLRAVEGPGAGLS
ncbi:MAG: SDR family oxidoreductase [Streptosporangiales bacterium]|nr:SDR family oxidoreductase [Streptosporangiales bacterium]